MCRISCVYSMVVRVLFNALLLLWCAIQSPFMWGVEHVESKCGQVSMALLGYSL